ncbi:MAG: type II CRISPR RNA-guided endonuclease Cas9 [Bacteroidota bacterium]
MKKILGLDLGTNSIGWALVDTDGNGKPCKIEGMGSRIIPMGTDKQDYEKGVGITKNATRREKRTARKGHKRYKLRRNKLLFILNELNMLPDQFKFKELNITDKNGKNLRLVGTKENDIFKVHDNGIPVSAKLMELELLPVSKETKQLDALGLLELKVKALYNPIELKDFGKILYQFNQLRGYSGGNNDEDNKKKKDEDEDAEKKKYVVIVQKGEILKVEQSDNTFTVRGGKNKGEKQYYFDIKINFNGEEIEGQTELQNLKVKEGQEEELEIRITRKKDVDVTYKFALPQKSNWCKAMELSEKTLKEEKLFISQLRLKDLQQNKWAKIRNRVFLRNRYKEEFDKIWETQEKKFPFLKNCPKETLEKIANYIFPGNSKSQLQLRNIGLEKGLKFIINEQVIYYQRPLKPQTELVGNCRFEKEEKVIPTSHPFFQEFRCWKQINNLFITTKTLVGNKYTYQNRYLTPGEKQAIYEKLQIQKEVGFATVIDILNQDNNKGKLDKEQKDYFLNGLNVKAKLKGCDTILSFKKELDDNYNNFISQNVQFVEQLWSVIFDVKNHEGSEYDTESKRVASIISVLNNYTDEKTATELSLKLAQKIKFPRKYASLSEKAIRNILPLMLPNPQSINETIQQHFRDIQHLIETGEVVNDLNYDLEDYVIDFVKNNPNILQGGGLMESFAISLVFGKHTAETIKAQIKNYHDIKYEERNLRNPVVEQLSNETMQVIKAIWKQYKFNPEELEIRVELARDLKNSSAERENIWKGQIKSKKNNDRIKERLEEHNIHPTDENILKYRLYEQQKEMAPYTQNKIIPFSALFDKRLYDIDHIIPKSRYYDDSISNKVLCEANINEEKSNRTAWEFITGQHSQDVRSVEDFVKYVNNNFFGKKKKNLLAEKIPSNPVERQLKDTQYISVAIKNELAKIVGSDNVKTSTGEVTDFLRSRWGLRKLFMELTENRFKQMELWDLDENGNPKTKWVTRTVIDDGEKKKNLYEIKNWSKRYDHRHHSIDALVVALTTQSHIQRLNNLNKYYQDELTARKDEFKIEIIEGESVLEGFFNLEAKRRDEILRQIESSRYFEKPLANLVEQVKNQLETMIVSHKPKDKLGIKTDEFDKNTPDKILKKQIKVRAGLHQETYYGKLNGRDTKRVELSSLFITKNKATKQEEIVELIDKVLEKEIIEHKKQYDSIKEAFTGEGLKAFNDNRIISGKQPAYKVKIWYNKEEKKESGLQRLYDNNDKQSVITGDNYLFLVMEKNGKRIFDIASLYDSVSIANDAIKENINNFKNKITEVYRMKNKEKPHKVLFTLQQNELVYLPTDKDDLVLNKSNAEFVEWISNIENKKEFSKRVYKVVKFTGKDCFFVPHNYANSISVPKDISKEDQEKLKEKYGEKSIPKQEKNFEEFGSFGNCAKMEHNNDFIKELVLKKSFKGESPQKIQDYCIKVKTDWLGNISL